MAAKDDGGQGGPDGGAQRAGGSRVPTEAQRKQAADAADDVPDDESDCPIDFNTFVLSLSASAAMHLGMVPNPMTGESEVSLPLARQTIDLLAVLESKTEGNLTGEEERLLAQVLYDLRMQYATLSKTK